MTEYYDVIKAKALIAKLRTELAAAEKDNQELKDLMAKGFNKAAEAMLKPLKADLERYKGALEKIKADSYPGLAVKESTLLNRIYKLAIQVLPKEKPKNKP